MRNLKIIILFLAVSCCCFGQLKLAENGVFKISSHREGIYQDPQSEEFILLPFEGDFNSVGAEANFTNNGLAIARSSKKFDYYGAFDSGIATTPAWITSTDYSYVSNSNDFLIGFWIRIDEETTATPGAILGNCGVTLTDTSGSKYYNFYATITAATDTATVDMLMSARVNNGIVSGGYDSASFSVDVGTWTHLVFKRYQFASLKMYNDSAQVGATTATALTDTYISFVTRVNFGEYRTGATANSIPKSLDEFFFADGFYSDPYPAYFDGPLSEIISGKLRLKN